MKDWQGHNSIFLPNSTPAEVNADMHRQMVEDTASRAPFLHALDLYAIFFWGIASIVIILLIILVIWLIVGYFKNIFKLIYEAATSANITPLMLLRGVGIFVPFIGGVVGHIKDKPQERNEDFAQTKVERENIVRRIEEHQKLEPTL